MAKIDFYVRHNSNETMLNIYLSPEGRDLLLRALLKNGHIEGHNIDIKLELNARSEWVHDKGNPEHLRIPISLLNIQLSED